MDAIKLILVLILIFTEYGDGKRNNRKRGQQTQPDEVREPACTTTCFGDSVLNQNTCKCQCAKGYKYNRNRQRCEDINECNLQGDRCLGNCYNSAGSFRCECPSGYVLSTNGWDCNPEPIVLQCQGLVCYDGSRLNTYSCRCECGQGRRYNFLTEECDDLNECILDNHACGHGCINVPRGYKCYCPDGYVLGTDMKTCYQRSEPNRELPCNGKTCGHGAALDAHHCECECREGFAYDEMDEACVDIDECFDYRGWCEGTCVNKIGSYDCICPDGHSLNEDGWTCSPAPTPDPFPCPPFEWKCDNGFCVNEVNICNGYDDCTDNSDEQNCKRICSPEHEFQCANGLRCLDEDDICDSENDCGDFSDEAYCKCQDEKLQCRAWERRGECQSNPGWMNWNCRQTCEVCLPDDGVPSGEIALMTEPEQYYIRYSHEYAKMMQFTLRNAGDRPGVVGNTWSCDNVTAIPQHIKEDFRISSIYSKYTDAFRIPILGSRGVSDEAMRRACYVVRFMLGDRRDLRNMMYRKFFRVAVISERESTHNIPEHSQVARLLTNVRGLGGTLHIPVTSVGEENLLCRHDEKNRFEDILVHNMAHAIHRIGITIGQTDFLARLGLAYNDARRQALWDLTRADDTVDEYFAEGVQTFFNVNARYQYGIHNDIDNRDKLGRYDPELHDLISEIFPCMNQIVDRCEDQAEILTRQIKMNCRDEHRVRLVPTQAPTTEPPRNDEDLPDDCQDANEDCFQWALTGECEENPGWMHVNCRRSCNNCKDASEDSDPSCSDRDDSCESWAADGECKINPVWMWENCKKSCQKCD